MSNILKHRRGTTTQHSTFTGAQGEFTHDTTKNTVVVHDGSTAGGFPLARQDGTNAAGTWPINVSGNAATASTATQITTARNIGHSGDATGSASFNGTADITIPLTLATVNGNVGSFGSASAIPVVTVNAKGLVTAVSTATVAGGQYYGSAATKAIAYNADTISENITITAGTNGLSAGPITISTGYTVTVNGNWSIV